MPDDARAEVPPAGPQLVRWLRALADAVERDPALAARLAAEVRSGPTPNPSPRKRGEGDDAADGAGDDAADGAGDDAADGAGNQAEDSELPRPVVRHAKRATKFGAPTVAGRAPELGKGVPDPFAIAATAGDDALRTALDTLRAGTLRAIIRAHNLDPAGKLQANATDASMRKLILTAVAKAEGPSKTTGSKKKK